VVMAGVELQSQAVEPRPVLHQRQNPGATEAAPMVAVVLQRPRLWMRVLELCNLSTDL